MYIEEMIGRIVTIEGLFDVVGYLREIEQIDDSGLILAFLQEITNQGIEEEHLAVPCDLTEIRVIQTH